MIEKYSINMPMEVKRIIQVLEEMGKEAYIVGGCVRDSLMGLTPSDWDITTNASPSEMMDYFSCFEKVIPTGIMHGTVTVVCNGRSFEVTTFRTDGKYSDYRRPDEVIFTKTLTEDLARRDFTINAMVYNEKIGLIDYYDGLKDINRKFIRCVGKPSDRFREDALRMMRAVRFAAQLNFELEEKTKQGIIENSHLLRNISIERIRQEFNKIIISNPIYIKDLWRLGLLETIIPEFIECFLMKQDNPYHIYDVGDHIIHSMESIEEKLHLRLTMLLHDIAKPACKTIDKKGIGHFYGHSKRSYEWGKDILRRLKYDNAMIEKVSILILNHDQNLIDDEKNIRKWLSKLGEEGLSDLIKVKEADSRAQNPKYFMSRYEKLQNSKDLIREIIEKDQCFSMKDLKINGRDLMTIGYKQGEEIGKVLNILLDKVIENPELNETEKLMEIAKDSLNKNNI